MLVMVLKPPVLGFLVVSWRHPIGLHFVVVWWGSLAPGAVPVVSWLFARGVLVVVVTVAVAIDMIVVVPLVAIYMLA